jgi:hypothetical protein
MLISIGVVWSLLIFRRTDFRALKGLIKSDLRKGISIGHEAMICTHAFVCYPLGGIESD